MKFHKTKIEGVHKIELEPHKDERGRFARNFCKKEFFDAGLDFDIKQVNLSFTEKKGALRGLHYQKEPKPEGKIAQCLRGKIFDVVVDLRPESPTYGKWESFELGEKRMEMIFIPALCAHGFQTLTDNCLVQYFLSEFYAPEFYGGVCWNDSKFGIEWPITPPVSISDKDKSWPLWQK